MQIKKSNSKDDLTGLHTYRSFTEIIEEQIIKAEDKGTEFSLAFVDIDFFKKINDEQGHQTGDAVIKTLAGYLVDSLSDKAIVFRYGGEEFAIIFAELEKEQAFFLLEEIRRRFDKEHIFEHDKGNISLKVTFSAGISSFPEDGNRINNIIRKADEALYRAKSTGRNKICLSREEKMVTKTSHYTQSQLKRLAELAKKEEVGEAVLLREALDDVFKKYDDRLNPTS